jgi:hypothetical protein
MRRDHVSQATRQKSSPGAKSVFQEIGVVVGTADGALVVETSSGRFDAVRAASCLLEPEERDQILLAVPEEGPLFVLAVLTRAESAPSRLSLGRDARLVASETLRLEAKEEIGLATPGVISAAGDRLRVSADEGAFAVKKATFASTLLTLYTNAAKAVLGTLEAHLESLSTHAKRSQRFVEEVDLTRAGTIDQRAEGAMHLRAENTFVTAKELAKVDGEQIHIG